MKPVLSTAAVEVRPWAAAALAGAVLLVAAWGLLHVGFFADEQIIDTPVYESYGDAMLDGQVPYRDFEVEYPPGALPVFLLPSLAAADDYRGVFEGLMLACGLAAITAVAYTLAAMGAAPARLFGAVGLAALAPLALGSVVLTRYDLWPAALTAAALAALVADRSRLGLGLLAAGAAAKLYPLVLLPLALVYVARRSGRREALVSLGVFALVAAVIVVPFAIVSPDGLAMSLERQSDRPLQIESLGAALLLVGHELHFYEPTVVSSFGSQNLGGSLPDILAGVHAALQPLAVVAVWLLFVRGEPSRARLLVASAAAVTALVAFGKVLSPQFLIWLVPLVPLVVGAAPAALLVAALVLTQLWFPSRYWDLVALGAEAWLVLARDLVLVVLAVLLARELSRPRFGAPRTR